MATAMSRKDSDTPIEVILYLVRPCQQWWSQYGWIRIYAGKLKEKV